VTAKKKRLDLPQAIVVSVVLAAIFIGAGLVLTWGPADSRAQVAQWIAAAVAGTGTVFAAMRSRGLFHEHDDGGDE
jgi:hypothetical protein